MVVAAPPHHEADVTKRRPEPFPREALDAVLADANEGLASLGPIARTAFERVGVVPFLVRVQLSGRRWWPYWVVARDGAWLLFYDDGEDAFASGLQDAATGVVTSYGFPRYMAHGLEHGLNHFVLGPDWTRRFPDCTQTVHEELVGNQDMGSDLVAARLADLERVLGAWREGNRLEIRLPDWLLTPNRRLGGRRPVDVIREGTAEPVLDALAADDP